MPYIILIMFIGVLRSDPPKRLQEIKIYYHDTVSVKKKDFYRELTRIGEDPFWSKPEMIDVVLTINGNIKSSKEEIEILIEELYEPTSLNKTDGALNKKTWIPHLIVYSGNTNLVKSGKLEVKNIPYQTAYFRSSMLYNKIGFRITGVYYDSQTNKLETIKREIFYSI